MTVVIHECLLCGTRTAQHAPSRRRKVITVTVQRRRRHCEEKP